MAAMAVAGMSSVSVTMAMGGLGGRKRAPSSGAPIRCPPRQAAGGRVRSARGRRKSGGARAADEVSVGSVAGAGGDSVVKEVAVLEEEPATPGVATTDAVRERRPGMLQRGGTLSGKGALGKDPASSTLGKKSTAPSSSGGLFDDPRWVRGTWDLAAFTEDGKVVWDSVIDAEVKRRKWLEDNPEVSSNSDPVVFDTSIIPWWAWVKRFHLPEAELLNGRAAMVGYFAAYVVDSLTGVGIVDQQSSFLGKLLLFITVCGVMLVRKFEDLDTLKTLAKESNFYDKQWQASWKEDSAKEEKQPK